jgi:hypothetical protein
MTNVMLTYTPPDAPDPPGPPLPTAATSAVAARSHRALPPRPPILPSLSASSESVGRLLPGLAHADCLPVAPPAPAPAAAAALSAASGSRALPQRPKEASAATHAPACASGSRALPEAAHSSVALPAPTACSHALPQQRSNETLAALYQRVRAQLIDFGSSRSMTGYASALGHGGTPGFLAPELMSPEADYLPSTHESDM